MLVADGREEFNRTGAGGTHGRDGRELHSKFVVRLLVRNHLARTFEGHGVGSDNSRVDCRRLDSNITSIVSVGLGASSILVDFHLNLKLVVGEWRAEAIN